MSASETSGTACTTESAYKLASKRSISQATLREISIVSSLFITLSGPFLFTARKAYSCTSLLFDAEVSGAKKCGEKLFDGLTNPVNIMSYLSFTALVSLAALGAYAGSRAIFQDKTQEERFDLLNAEYSRMAKQLDETYKTTRKEEIGNVVEMAEKLYRNVDFIRGNLIRVAKLREPQANLLAAKISHTASLILSKERANSPILPPPAPPTLPNPSPTALQGA